MKKVIIDSKVLIKFKSGEKDLYQIVYPPYSDISQNKISIESPLGKSILGQRSGALVRFKNPYGKNICCRILAIINS